MTRFRWTRRQFGDAVVQPSCWLGSRLLVETFVDRRLVRRRCRDNAHRSIDRQRPVLHDATLHYITLL